MPSEFACKACGYRTVIRQRACAVCGARPMVSARDYDYWLAHKDDKPKAAVSASKPNARVGSVDSFADESTDRIKIGWKQLDYFFGGAEGGIQKGAVYRLTGAPGAGKCLCDSAELLNADTGELFSIREWKTHLRPVVSINPDTMRLASGPVSAFHAQGVKPVVRVKTRLGRVIRCTDTHPFLATTGWQPIGTLEPGAFIATPRAMPWFGNEPMPDHEIRVLAYAIGDGYIDKAIRITASEPEIMEDLHRVADAYGVKLHVYKKTNSESWDHVFGGAAVPRSESRAVFASALRRVHADADISWAEWARRAGVDYSALVCWRQESAVPNADELRRLASAVGVSVDALGSDACDAALETNTVAKVFERHGLRYLRSAHKFVPPAVMRLPKEQLALFLRCLFSCDGSVFVRANGAVGLSYSTTSERLARDVQHLLLRFGIVVRLRTKIIQYKNEPYTSYELVTAGVAPVRDFLAQIGIAGRDEAKAKIAAMPYATTPSTHMDMVPTGPVFWDKIRALSPKGYVGALGRASGVTLHDRRHDRPLPRSTVAAVAQHTQDPWLLSLACADVYWDEIESITPDGETEVFDLTVPEHANFVANDIIVHNSTLLAQIAAATGAMYCCSEESGPRVATRMRRLGLTGLDKVQLVIGASMARAKRNIEERRPKLIIVDSLQTFQYISEEAEEDVDAVDLKANENHDDAVTIAIDFIKWAQKTKSAVILVNHLNKEGQAAGKIKIDYLIDGNFDLKGDQNSFLRLLTATKNRTSATAGVVASFWMTKRGLIDVPKGDAAEALERLIAEGVIDPPLEQLEKEENEPERTFDQFEKEADGPREKPTKSRRSARGHAP